MHYAGMSEKVCHNILTVSGRRRRRKTRTRTDPPFLPFTPLPLSPDRSPAILVASLGERTTEMALPTEDLIQGTLDLLILKALSLQPMHGWGVALRIQQISNDALQVNQGSLYPALHKLERRGWIEAAWGVSDNNRRAKYYSLTTVGRRQLEQELANWERFTAAVSLVLRYN